MMPTHERRKLCEAASCVEVIKPSAIMCEKHWTLIPSELRLEMTDALIDGRRGDMTAHRRFLVLKDRAIRAVVAIEKSLRERQK
jgi:hypothetical protein